MKVVARIIRYLNKHPTLRDCLCIAVLTIPAIASLLQGGYFSMHDDQHIVRLYQFDKALREGNLYPRWVDGLGFGFGYPLFNFYPPFIYFVAEFFHLFGASLIWSVKLMLIVGFISAAIGMFLLVKNVFNRQAGYVAAVLYTYFFYHATTIYVRGAFAEFFSMSVLPFLFLSYLLLYRKQTLRRLIFVSICQAIILLTHPLIAFPTVLYTASWFIFLYSQSDKSKKIPFTIFFTLGTLLGLAIAAFFWLPSMVERQFTYVDSILTKELANYAIHFVYPQQFWQSLWGYGGSIPGPNDGMTFQLGKIHIFLAFISSMVLFALYILQPKKKLPEVFGIFTLSVLTVSLFMTTFFSKPLWDLISFLWYLQFPWRFFTFIAIFISILGSILFYYLFELSRKFNNQAFTFVVVASWLVIIAGSIGIYGRYFKPQEIRKVTDAELTTYDEITWRISRSSFEFVPNGVSTKKSEMGTTILAIDPADREEKPYTLVKGKALVEPEELKASKKSFIVKVGQPIVFRLNTFNFPGWEATLMDSKSNLTTLIEITDDNPYKLITVNIPPGEYLLEFTFQDTPVRFFASLISLVSIAFCCIVIWKEKQVAPWLLSQLKKIER